MTNSDLLRGSGSLRHLFVCGLLSTTCIAGNVVSAFAQAAPPPVVIPPQASNFVVKPDGTTQTTATTSPSGKITVQIAKPNASGTSLNRYKQFDVPKAGVDLDNQQAVARLIVNEVTGALPSRVNGDVTVLGPKAHVILANPNGITVDGGRFLNTGGVVLATGSTTLTPGGVRIDGSSGKLSVTGAGLAIDGASLDLIGGSVDIDGPIHSGASPLAVVGGRSVTTIDASASPETAIGLAQSMASGLAQGQGIAIQLSNQALLNGGAIRLVVTDAGAGVRMAGGTVDAKGKFSISANGSVEIVHSTISAKDAVSITGGSIAIGAGGKSTTIASSTSGVSIKSHSAGIRVKNAKIASVRRDNSSFAALGGTTLDSASDLVVDGSQGRVALDAAADGIALTAKNTVAVKAADLNAQDTLLVSTPGGIDIGDSLGKVGAISMIADRAISWNATSMSASGGVRLQAGRVDLTSAGATQASLRSTQAGVTMIALEGDVINNGMLIQGAAPTSGDADSDGGITVRAARHIINQALGNVHVAELLADSGTLSLNAGQNITNVSGSVLANGDIKLKAGGVLTNLTALVGASDPLLVNKKTMLGLGSKTKVALNYGTPLVTTKGADGTYARAMILAGGQLSVATGDLRNEGAVLAGDRVVINAASTVTSSSLLAGYAWFKRKCRLLCSASGGSAVEIIEGRISGNDRLELTAGKSVTTIGAQFDAGNDVIVKTPAFAAKSLLVPQIILRPAGLGGLFHGHDGRFAFGYDGGFVGSFQGGVTIEAGDIRVEGTSIYSGKKSLVYKTAPVIVTMPPDAGFLPGGKIGLFSGWLQ
ncbi:two-partner secretion domain-containing protein [Labrys neptuniae]